MSGSRRKRGAVPGIAKRLIEARNRLGLTQREMASRLGISLRTYSLTEMDQRALDLNEVAQLGQLGIDAQWLVTGSLADEMPIPAPAGTLDNPLRPMEHGIRYVVMTEEELLQHDKNIALATMAALDHIRELRPPVTPPEQPSPIDEAIISARKPGRRRRASRVHARGYGA